MQTPDTHRLLVLRALVVDNQDPDKLGRVRVKYPSLSKDSASIPSEWARLCQSYASRSHGEWNIPEINDEVLVVFEGPNLAHPIVLGSLYGKANPPPTTDKASDHLHFTKSKSGNLLVFSDVAGEEGIQAKDAAGAELNLKKGKLALGNKDAELFDLLEQLLTSIAENAPTMVSTAVGPGVLNPKVLDKVKEVKSKIAQMKGKLG